MSAGESLEALEDLATEPEHEAADTERPEPPPASDRPLCFVAMPHSGAMCPESMSGLTAASSRCRVDVVQQGSSLLCHNFNRLWAHGLNAVPRPQYFAMHHSDILAPPGWVDTLIDEMEAHDAVMCSAVVAIKDFHGLTSTALMNAGEMTLRRVTAHEMTLLPKTFDGETLRRLWDVPEDAEIALCVNSGLWVCRFDALAKCDGNCEGTGRVMLSDGKTELDCPNCEGRGAYPFAEKVCFEIGDRITRDPDEKHPSGFAFVARTFSEDWMFSAELAKRGLKVVATQKLPVIHFGRAPFGTGGEQHRPWGDKADRWITL